MRLNIQYGEAKQSQYDYDRELNIFEMSKQFKDNILDGNESLEEKIKLSVKSIRETKKKWKRTFL